MHGRAAFLLPAAAALAMASWAAAQSRADVAVARLGERAITVGDVERRLRLVAPSQLAELGSTRDEIRRRFLDELVRMDRRVLGALGDGLDRRTDVRERIQDVLRRAMLNEVRDEVLRSGVVTADAVAAYYAEHRDRYQSELRLKLWQIVVGTREEAAKILEHIRSDAGYARDPMKGWEELVQKHSLDKSTAGRKGDAGLVRPDGSTPFPDTRLSPAVYRAALAVEDGEVVPEPLEDGRFWLVVQRRGSQRTPERTLESEAPTIRMLLARERIERGVRGLLDAERQKHVRDLHPEHGDKLEITLDGELAPSRRPGSLPVGRHAAAGAPQPTGRPGDYR
jgi:hypothetical protein